MSRRKSGVPVLLADAFQARNGTFHTKAWCPHCVDYHTHGGIDSSHRVAHCAPGSPWKNTGYYLKLDRDNPSNIELQRKYRFQQKKYEGVL